jgi:Spy/CpxP family protein refolding chaperone
MKGKVITALTVGLILPGLLLAGNLKQDRRMAGKRARLQQPILSILDEGQAEEWSKLRLTFEKQRNEISAKLKNSRLELQHLMKSSRLPDEKEVGKLQNDVLQYSNQLQRLRIEQQLALRNILTDEQWAELKDMKKRQRSRPMLNRMRDHRSRHHQIMRRFH